MEKIKNIKNLLIGGALLSAVFGILPVNTQAATLYFSPQSGSYTVGSSLVVNIYVSSSDQVMNAASGLISFPKDKLEITSISKNSSIFNLWVQEPSFSNSAGTVNFEGIVLNPGFTGTNGKILSITFIIKAADTASITFSSGSVLANDGKGTNILTGMGNATFQIGVVRPEESDIITPSQILDVPSAPEISSATHPDPNKWYAVKKAKFTWSVPKDITGVRLAFGKIPQSVPTVLYTPPINFKEVGDLIDGTFYFHARFRNASGWGDTAHFRFQIDTLTPEPFTIQFVDGKETDNPRPTVLFNTTDALSGVDYYKIKIGEGDFFILQETEVIKDNPYTLPFQRPGKRTITIQAYDMAGNYATATEEFITQAIESPTIIEYPKELQSGEVLAIKGKTKYPDAQINLWLQHEKDEPKNYSVKSDKDGKFIFIAEDKLLSGVYTAWAEVVDMRGAKSEPSEKVTIVIRQPAFWIISSWTVSFLAILISLTALIIVLVFLLRNRFKKKVREAEGVLYKTFDLLKEDIRNQIKMLEKTKTKRQLIEEEQEKIIEQLKKHFDDAEKFVRKEIEDIEKEVK